MVFTSLEFILLFFPIVFALYYLLPKGARNGFLLVAGLAFYVWGGGRSVLVLLASVLINYVSGVVIEKSRPGSAAKKLALAADIALNVGILFAYKYRTFFTQIVASLAPGGLSRFMAEAGSASEVVLPIGISFFTFKGISYAIDVYRGTPAQRNPVHFGLYLSFFPQLLAGPIGRYPAMKDQLADRSVTAPMATRGFMRFILGFNKKVLLADILCKTADIAFSAAPNSVCMSWLGAVCYTLQIYYDFAGYSDMAIGLAAMLGFDTAENFDYPYISRTVTEFWRRWHISLGTWFRDYVYFPLGGSRVKRGRMILNLFVVWLLTGIWHGANWTFIVWGLMYGAIISVEKLAQIPRRLEKARTWARVLYRLFALLTVVVGWVVFRSDSLEGAFRYLATMFGLAGQAFSDGAFVFNAIDSRLFILLGALFSMPVWQWLERRASARGAAVGNALAVGFDAAQVLLFVVSLSCIVVSAHNPFVYINF